MSSRSLRKLCDRRSSAWRRTSRSAAVKTGMLATAEIVRGGRRDGRPIPAAEPRRRSGHGRDGRRRRTLLAPEAVSILKTGLLPLAIRGDAKCRRGCGAVAAFDVNSLDTAREAARRILDLGPGGSRHQRRASDRGPQAIDVLFHAGTFTEFAAPRVADSAPCTARDARSPRRLPPGLRSATTSRAAVERAKRYVTGAIEQSFEIGRGARVLNHFWNSSVRGLYSKTTPSNDQPYRV